MNWWNCISDQIEFADFEQSLNSIYHCENFLEQNHFSQLLSSKYYISLTSYINNSIKYKMRMQPLLNSNSTYLKNVPAKMHRFVFSEIYHEFSSLYDVTKKKLVTKFFGFHFWMFAFVLVHFRCFAKLLLIFSTIHIKFMSDQLLSFQLILASLFNVNILKNCIENIIQSILLEEMTRWNFDIDLKEFL